MNNLTFSSWFGHAGYPKAALIPLYFSLIRYCLKYFFKGLDDLEYKGSMFTIRAVYPNKDHNDERPTVVEKVNSKHFVLFSGKISPCVDASYELYNKILYS